MSRKDLCSYITNPILGLFPFLVYLWIFHFTRRVDYALGATLFLAGISEIFIRKYTKTKACGMMFRMTFFVSAITLFIWLFFRNETISDHVFSVIFEIFFVFLLIIIGLSKTYINHYFFKRDSILEKMYLNDFFKAALAIQYTFTLHVFFLYIYRYFNTQHINLESDTYFIWIPIIAILALMIGGFLKMSIVLSKLKKEEWLPIVSERGEVTGKIARTVSQEMGNRFLHPIVRIALICKGVIYLQPNKDKGGKLDHPFEKSILFKEEINIAARDCVGKLLMDKNISLKFSLKYISNTPEARHLVFLYIARIENEDQLKNIDLNGRFWISQQINDNIEEGIFSKYFEQEYEYLKNTALIPTDKFQLHVIQ